jgi:hypothetical protein
LIAQTARFVRYPRVSHQSQSFGLPRVSRSAAVALSVVMNQSGPFWIGAGAITAALIIFGTVNHKLPRQAAASLEPMRIASLGPVSRETVSVIYRGAERETFAERWGPTPFEPVVESTASNGNTSVVAKGMQTFRVASAGRDDITFATAYAPAAPSGGFTLASVNPQPVLTDRATSPEEVKALVKMDEVERYLWEVYLRAPTKKDGSGDFTWKDPAAAQRFGLSMPAYVISGMDPDFREQLYHMGRAMDAAGIKWAILSAFRDDYRQTLASGFKASPRNSLHGGSARTGGYGHGRAVDVTGAEGNAQEVWKWIDANGAKYGLHRPMRAADPPHVQSTGDWRKLAQALKQARIRIAQVQSDKQADKQVTAAKPSKAVASAAR